MNARDIEDALDKFAYDSGFTPADPYYIRGEFNLTTPSGESLYTDEGHLWCKACADALLAKALPLLHEAEREDHFVSGTEACGQDSPESCSQCGEVLNHTLSENGVAYELNHYGENPITDVSPAQAWGIARIVESAPDDDEAVRLGLDALDAIKAGRIWQPQSQSEAPAHSVAG